MTTHCHRRPPTLHALCLATLTSLAAGPVLAETSPYYIGVAQSIGHESNLYRIGDNQVLPAGLTKSDSVSGSSLIGGVDQTIGRQRVYGSLNLRANRYANNKSLDNESYGLNLALDWATINRLSGTLSLASDQNLAQFNSRNSTGAVETVKNVARNQQVDAKVRLGVVTKYTLEAGLGYRQRSYSAAAYDSNEFKQTNGSLGLRYRPSSALGLGAALRLTHAKYPRFRQTGVTTFESDTLQRRDLDLTANWVPSALSEVNVRLSPTHTSYDRNTANDFSGVTGSANWLWRVSGKTRLNTTFSRDTGQSSDAIDLGLLGAGVVDYSQVSTTLRLRAEHELTGKISLNAALTHTNRELADTITATGGATSRREGSDNTTALALGGRWAVTRSTQLGCDLSTERRRSNNTALSVPLSANSFSCYGQFVLQ